MTRLHAAPALEAGQIADQAVAYFYACREERGPSYAAERVTNWLADVLTERQTGMHQIDTRFAYRHLRAFWEEVNDGFRFLCGEVASFLRDGMLDEARRRIAELVDFASPTVRP